MVWNRMEASIVFIIILVLDSFTGAIGHDRIPTIGVVVIWRNPGPNAMSSLLLALPKVQLMVVGTTRWCGPSPLTFLHHGSLIPSGVLLQLTCPWSLGGEVTEFPDRAPRVFGRGFDEHWCRHVGQTLRLVIDPPRFSIRMILLHHYVGGWPQMVWIVVEHIWRLIYGVRFIMPIYRSHLGFHDVTIARGNTSPFLGGLWGRSLSRGRGRASWRSAQRLWRTKLMMAMRMVVMLMVVVVVVGPMFRGQIWIMCPIIASFSSRWLGRTWDIRVRRRWQHRMAPWWIYWLTRMWWSWRKSLALVTLRRCLACRRAARKRRRDLIYRLLSMKLMISATNQPKSSLKVIIIGRRTPLDATQCHDSDVPRLLSNALG